MTAEDPGVYARGMVDAISYMTLGTADADGRPWATPVWFASSDYREFFWISRPTARHSENLAARPQLGIVIFDSTVPAGHGRGVYIDADARQLSAGDAQFDRGLAVFSRRSVESGLEELAAADVQEPAPHRLYCATASELFVLDEHDQRVPVSFDELAPS